MLGLYTRDLQSSLPSFKRNGLDLEGLSLRERKFDLRESLDGRLGSLGRSPWWGSLERKLWEESFSERPKMRGVGVYL